MIEYAQLYPVIAATVERESLGFPDQLASLHPSILRRVDKEWGESALKFIEALLFGMIQEEFSLSSGELEEVQMLRHLLRHNFVRTQELATTSGQGSWPLIRSRHELIMIAALQSRGEHQYEMKGKPLGAILAHYGQVSPEALNQLVHERAQKPGRRIPIGQMLLEQGLVSEEGITRALCIQSGILMASVADIYIPSEVLRLIPTRFVLEHKILPLFNYNDSLYLAVGDPFSTSEKQLLGFLAGMNVVPVYAPVQEITEALQPLYGDGKSLREADAEFRNLAKEALDTLPDQNDQVELRLETEVVTENDITIIHLVDRMIRDAISVEASDIHIEHFVGQPVTEIRFRRDGRMERFSDFSASYHNAVVSRIKIMADLNIAERRLPQDGKISFHLPEHKVVDLRVSTIPTNHGIEFVTIRILPSGVPLPLMELGMCETDMNAFREVFHRAYGLILVCGPTGSGKTTTLHSVLRELNTPDRKIWTAEDPVEISQEHLCQVQVNTKIGLTFDNLLRSFLRADPDIIMIGEMRDHETARIALVASMTGHLVLSTLHTNSAPETVARLLDLGIDPFNLSDALLAVLAQRLARKLCLSCAKREPATADELDQLASEYHFSSHSKLPTSEEKAALITEWRQQYGKDGVITLGHPVGCPACHGGYRGRIGFYELLRATPAVKQLVRAHAGAAEYLQVAMGEGMMTLKQDGIHKVLAGITDMLQVRGACN